MASARQPGTNENVSTYAASGADYSAIATWEGATDNDLVTAAQSEVLECEAGVYNDTLQMVTTVATTDANYHRIVRAAAGAEVGGIPGNGVCFETSSGGTAACFIGENYVKLYDIGIKLTKNSASNHAAVYAQGRTGTHLVGLTIYDCANAGSGGMGGISAGGQTDSVIIDCVVLNCKSIGIATAVTSGSLALYNCTSIGNGASGFTGDSSVIAKNCLASGNTTDFGATFSASSVANASSDATAPGIGPRTSQTFTFADSDNDDYHLTVADTGARGRGADLSADSTFDFDDDIDGNTIPWGSWSIGASWVVPSSRRTAINENISTFGDASRDYTNIQTWEAATDNDLVTAAQSEVLECYDDSSPYSHSCSLSGATTNVDYFRIIRAAPGHEHRGSLTEGVHLKGTWNGTGFIQILESYSSCYDIAVGNLSANSASTFAAFRNAATFCRFVGCFAYDCENTGSGGFRGINPASADSFVVNCLALRIETVGILGEAVRNTIYNCTCIECGTSGPNLSQATSTMTNCLAEGHTTADTAGIATESYNATEDASASGTGSRANQTFTFMNRSNDNYHLSSGDQGAKGFGTDLSADTTFPFNDDIDGVAITDWSIGFDSDPSLVGGITTFLRRRRRSKV